MILASSNARSLEDIGEELGVHSETVRRWVSKFNQRGLEGITPGKRGPRLRFSMEQREQILRIANTSPKELGQEFSEWSSVKLANYAVEQGITESISHVSVRQILVDAGVWCSRGGSARKEKAEDVSGNAQESALNVDSSQRGVVLQPAPSEGNADNSHTAEALSEAARLLAVRKFREAQALLSPLLEDPSLSPDEEAAVRCSLCEAYEGAVQYAEMRKVLEVYETAERRNLLSPLMLARARLKLGWAYSLDGNHPRAFARLNEALRTFVELNDAQRASETHCAFGRTYIQINEYKIARDHLLEAVHYQRFENDRALLAQIYHRLGLVDYYEGDFAGAKAHSLKALDLARHGSDFTLLGQVTMNLGLVAMYDDFLDRKLATERFKEAIRYFEQGDQRDFIALVYNNLGDNLFHNGEWDETERYLYLALEKASDPKASRWQACALVTLGELYCHRGQYTRAKDYLDQSLDLLASLGNTWIDGVVHLVLGSFYVATGGQASARKHLNTSLQLATSLGNQFGIIIAEVSLGELFLAERNLAAAAEHLRAAETGLRRNSVLALSGKIKRLRGLLDFAHGRTDEAAQHLAQSVAAFRTAQDVFEEARSRFELSRVLFSAGELQAALGDCKEALEVFNHLRAVPAIRGAEELLTRISSSAPGTAKSEIPRRVSPADIVPISSKGAAAPAPASPTLAELTGAVSPLSLMERLLEAASSRELVLQELVSISEFVYRSSQPLQTVIYRVLDGQIVQPLIVRGMSLHEAETRKSEISEALQSGRDDAAGTKVALIEAGEQEAIALAIRPSSGARIDLHLLRPFIKQAEVALENCSLRSDRRSAKISASEAVKYSVREAIPGFIYASQAMADVVERIHKIRRSDVTVLITGESGTGKELVARTIHEESARRGAIFLPYNCTAVSPELIESQLFGHRRGSFTGALDHYQGIVRAAEGGTLFLDEIGDLTLQVQPKLLRFLQEGEIQPVGQAKPEKVDVRVITATNTELERAVDEGRFREDLYHRLNIIRIHVPPLRERPEEIPVLAEHYLEHFAKRSSRSNLTFSREALDLFLAYEWPGNVRQLRNEIERAVAYADSEEVIRPSELSSEILKPRRGSVHSHEHPAPDPSFTNAAGRSGARFTGYADQRSGVAPSRYSPDWVRRRDPEENISSLPPHKRDQWQPETAQVSPGAQESSSLDSPFPPAASGQAQVPGAGSTTAHGTHPTPASRQPQAASLKEATEQFERQVITEALRKHRYNVTKTAAELGISRRSLRVRIDQLAIEL